MKPKWFQEIESLYFWNLWCFHGKFWSFWWFFFFVTWFEAPKPVVFDQNSSWAGFQIVPITLFCFIPQKRFLKEPLRGIPFVWVLSFLYLIAFWNFTPLRRMFFISYCVGGGGGGGGGGRIYLKKNVGKTYYFFFFFF